jgi:hypothetical protein
MHLGLRSESCASAAAFGVQVRDEGVQAQAKHAALLAGFLSLVDSGAALYAISGQLPPLLTLHLSTFHYYHYTTSTAYLDRSRTVTSNSKVQHPDSATGKDTIRFDGIDLKVRSLTRSSLVIADINLRLYTPSHGSI